ncbi:MAG: hypothetical protein RMY34_16880 [Aulosira sp. DedQUE10]|nr:hypothetical protein [Aulosira sp. DedQUE10]
MPLQLSVPHQLAICCILLICQIPAWAAVITIVEQYVINGKANPISALKRAFSKWSKFLWKENKTNWEAMIALAFFFASDYLANIFPFNLLLLIPGYIFLVRIFFIMEARYLRDLDIDSADIYSKSIVQGRWKKVFFIITSLAINNYLLAVLFAITLNLLAEIIPAIKPGVDMTFYFIRTLINDIWFIVGTLLFLNLEYRKN